MQSRSRTMLAIAALGTPQVSRVSLGLALSWAMMLTVGRPTPYAGSQQAGRRSARTPGKLPTLLPIAAGILLASNDGSPPIRMVGGNIKIVEIGMGGAIQVSFEESRPPPAAIEGCA